MRRSCWAVCLALALAACAAGTAEHATCHRAARADGVSDDGELHYPELCPGAPRLGPLDGLTVDTPDPCRQYARAHCAHAVDCRDAVREVNDVMTQPQPYAKCIELLKGA
ncbi:MAG TPA: hypothetical protein VGF94_30630 [Kofleriaceae bacterium]|jgi:hypothetical protein